MNLRLLTIGLCILLIIMMTGCNLPADENTADITLTSVASAGSASDDIEETAEVEATDEIEATDEVDDIEDTTPEQESSNQQQPASSLNTTNTNVTTSNTSTRSNSPCTPRGDWIRYTVATGDTLGQIARRTDSTVEELSQANCLDDANLLNVGQALYVPRQPSTSTTNSNNNQTSTNNADTSACRILVNTRTEVVNLPQGTSATILGYLPAGSVVEPTVQISALNTYGFNFNGQTGWINIQPTGDCSQLDDLYDQPPNDDNTCRIYVNTRTEVVNAPQGTGRTILGYLPAGSVVEPTIHFEGLPYYGFNFNGQTGWIDAQPDGDCSNLPNTPPQDTGNNDPSQWDCFLKPASNVQLYAQPDSSSQVMHTLQAGTTYEVTAQSPGSWYQIQYANPSRRGWTQMQPGGSCQSLEQYVYDCQFVGDTVVPIYKRPEIGSEQWESLQAGDVYRFGSYAGTWTSGDVTGYWVEVFYNPQRAVAGYIQNTGGHLEGQCPTR